METPDMTPEPDEAERQAIVEALAAERAEHPAPSEWAATVLPGRGEEHDEPYPR